jgi:hypothetical protein
MNKIKRLAVFLWNGKKTVKYLPWLCLPPIALLTALYFTFAQQSGSFPDVLQNRRFLIACAWSFLPAIILLFYIQALNYVLDVKFSWHKKPWKRLKRQLFMGVLLPGLFLASYYTVYYSAYGKNVFHRKYFQIEFPMALLAITCVNFVYMTRYLLVKGIREMGPSQESLLSRKQEELPAIYQNILDGDRTHSDEVIILSKKKKVLIKIAEIVCVMRWERMGALLLETGVVYQMDNTLDYMLDLLDSSIFVKTNRWCIINLRYVDDAIYKDENGSRIVFNEEAVTLFEKLRPEVSEMLKEHGKSGFLTTDKYKLSRSFRKNFMERLEALRQTEA